MRAPKVGVSAADEVGVVIEDVLVVVVELQVGVVDSIIIVLKDHMTVMRRVTAEIRSSKQQSSDFLAAKKAHLHW